MDFSRSILENILLDIRSSGTDSKYSHLKRFAENQLNSTPNKKELDRDDVAERLSDLFTTEELEQTLDEFKAFTGKASKDIVDSKRKKEPSNKNSVNTNSLKTSDKNSPDASKRPINTQNSPKKNDKESAKQQNVNQCPAEITKESNAKQDQEPLKIESPQNLKNQKPKSQDVKLRTEVQKKVRNSQLQPEGGHVNNGLRLSGGSFGDFNAFQNRMFESRFCAENNKNPEPLRLRK